MYDKISEVKHNMKKIIKTRGMTRTEKYSQIQQLNQNLSSTEQDILVKELCRDCDNYSTFSDIKDLITIGLMGFTLLISIRSLWVDTNGIEFSDYVSSLIIIMILVIFCIFAFTLTTILKNHLKKISKYLLDILEDK